MLKSIFSKKRTDVKYLIIIFVIFLTIVLTCSLQEKNWEYSEEKTGTIRKVWLKRPKSLLGKAASRLAQWLLEMLWMFHDCLQIQRERVQMRHVVLVILIIAILIALGNDSQAFYLPKSESNAMLYASAAVGIAHAVSLPDTTSELVRPGYKITLEEQRLLYEQLCKTPSMSSPKLLAVCGHSQITVARLNQIRKEWGLSRKQGRPAKSCVSQQTEIPIKMFSCVPKAGARLFSVWLEQTEQIKDALETIEKRIQEYKQANPQENFRLLHTKRETIAKKWLALTILPLLGIGKLSQLDYREHGMASVLGYAYSSSTLTQFLGELERVDVGKSLIPLLSKEASGEFGYIDGCLMAFWTRKKMHKGHITMLGRIMSGSKLIVAHDKFGKAIWFDFCPPDIHLTHTIEQYCESVVQLTGIKRFVIDREVNSVEIARLFVKRKWGLICLLDSNEYKGEESFTKYFAGTLEDNTVLYWAKWKHPKENDPRYFIIAKERERCLVYWCTEEIAKEFSAKEIVLSYRQRSDIQENSFKRMTSHGALKTNYGIKKIWGTDRTHQRKLEKLDQKIENIQARKQKTQQHIRFQIGKIDDSIEKSQHGLLIKRISKLERLYIKRDQLQNKIQGLETEKSKLGEPELRADRDFRKQTIMTFRTLSLENLLKDFIALFSDALKTPVDTDVILDLFFLRTGISVENNQQTSYWLDSQHLSAKYQCILKEIGDGFNHISLAHRGKRLALHIIDST